MSSTRRFAVFFGVGLALCVLAWAAAVKPVPTGPVAPEKAMQQGNFKDAYEAFRKMALDSNDDPRQVGQHLASAIQCLQNLGRQNEIDEFREAVIKVHAKNWRLLQAAAETYLNTEPYGFIIAGKFQRGQHRGGGQMASSLERDRVRALQLMLEAMPLAQKDEDHPAVGNFFRRMAQLWLQARGSYEAWRLQSKTDLGTLPDYEPGSWWGRGGRDADGAPVDEQGNPVYHTVPKSFEAAESDGQRWRWCLVQAVEFDPNLKDDVKAEMANFFQSQFGVQTMAQYGAFFSQMDEDETKKNESGTYALHTLGEDETIARLATGVKRFKLPDEFNPVKIYRELSEQSKTQHVRLNAFAMLGQIFEDRRQYPKAADCWRECLKLQPTNNNWQQRLDQVIAPWGRFENAETQPAGKVPTLDFRFRNGRSVSFTAREVLVEKLLNDVKTYIKTPRKDLDWNMINLGDMGYRFVQDNQKKYIGREVAAWSVPLEPRPNHFDKRVTIKPPLEKAGAYWITAKMQGGNECYAVLWVADTAIAKKMLDGKAFYYVADAVSGKPVAKANVEFFGFQNRWENNKSNILTKQFAEFSNAEGQVMVGNAEQDQQYQWLIMARTEEGRLAFLGFTHVWFGNRHDPEYNATKVFTITDRPVYRPNQKVHFKFWVRHAKYDQADASDFANRDFAIEVRNPKNDKVLSKTVKSDAYGGIEGELDLPADAALGVYHLTVLRHGGGTFRVEEYKKPEFEVSVDAPAEPVMLGDKIQATIKAKYYFGAPVTKAKVKYKVERTTHSDRWYPIGRWDWLYGRGYWWFADEYPWYPGWASWGWPKPIFAWWPHFSHQPPEVVASREVEIGHDGTVKVDIDTSLAKAVHPGEDHKYTVTVEVVDQSRRTINGSGSVLAARKPFAVTGWLNRGHYRVGDTIEAHFAARTLDGKPVKGKGILQLLQISYKDGKPVETAVQGWAVETNAEGQMHQSIKASAAGQFRLSYKLTDAKNHTIEGAYLFTIIGEGFSGDQFRFNDLEIVPEKAEYAPGEKVRLLINTNRPGGTVLLFLRPTNGIYLPPKMIRMAGKSTVEELEVVTRDMPNFFVEALCIADGRVHVQTKEIVVPPEKRILNVAVEPSSDTYRPGQKASAKIRLTDLAGKPFVGSTVVAIYDKSVEYISGGSNVPEIKEFFWKWRRHHNPQTEHSLSRFAHNVDPPNKPGMSYLGTFGASVADDAERLKSDEGGVTMFGGMGGGMGGMVMKAAARSGGMMPAAPTSAAVAFDAAFMEQAANGANRRALAGEKQSAGPGGPSAEPALVQPTVRSQFADTALWVGAITTDASGAANVSLNMPENLTTWRIKAWAMGHGTKVGEGSCDVVTRKDLIIRLQAPRFFVQKDEVTLSANVHNYLKTEKSVKVVLELDGKTIEPIDPVARTVTVKPNDEARVDWRVKVTNEGEAVVRMKALTDEESDAMEQKFPCYVHGMLKQEAFSGVIRPQQNAGQFTINVPAERRPEQTRLEVRFSPTLAGAMVDALPYMVDYPYGCTEQTLNRFLPTVVTQKVLLEMGLNLDEIQKKRTNLNAQELGGAAARAAQWKRFPRNPVFDQEEVRRMVKTGVQRLTEMQCSDGGWGWFSGWGEHSYVHTTAVVLHGLQIAKQNDVAIVPGVMERGVEWLKRHQAEQIELLKNAEKKPKPTHWKDHADDTDALVYMVLVDAGAKNADMREFLYRDRTKLSVYAKAMIGLAFEKEGEKEKLAMMLDNLRQYLQQDDENQTAWLKLPEGNYWWCWYGSDIEAQAYYLKLLAKTDPKGEVAARLVKYLLNNRKNATYWNSTRDTSIAIEAMADFLRASGEQKPEMTVELYFDGQLQKAVEVTPQTLFNFDNTLVLAADQVAAGKHVVELKRKGAGPVYFNGYLTNFTLEDHIAKAGLEVKVERKYYRLKKVEATVDAAGARGQVVKEKIEKFQREELANLATVKSGDLVEIELEIASKNDYEYLIFEDMKPAGFEPVDVRSGYTGNAMGAYVEFRDNRVVFFVRALAQGNHSVAYRMRAEIPGKFSALPTKAAAMYAPELKANSDEIKLNVQD